jgi:hypothetical protein
VLDHLPARITPPSPEQAAAIRRRIEASDFALWERELAAVGYCAHPVRLRGSIAQVDRASGELREVYTTDHQRNGVLLKRCGSRLASRCPACAWTYQQDAYHLLRAGLTGDQTKGTPATVAGHPRLFVTLTAPSFGAVHGRDKTKTGQVKPCHPRDGTAATCPHGRRLDCRARHDEHDPRIGEPLCARCYDYQRAVAFNTLAPELWRRTVEYAYRHLADVLDVSKTAARRRVRIAYAKVAEWQARGGIHFHAILRLDAAPSAPDAAPAPPPDRLSATHLRDAVEWAATNVPPPDPAGLVRWGTEFDIRDLAAEARPGATVTEEQVAAYVAKYATKSAGDTFGAALARPIRTPDELGRTLPQLRAHPARLVQVAWTLGRERYAHAFGFGGHFLTKSRRYSTTFTALRRRRAEHARGSTGPQLDAWDRPLDAGLVEVVTSWTCEGTGHQGSTERWLALAAAARAREHRRNRAGFPTRTAA